jgi:hypothetical protein
MERPKPTKQLLIELCGNNQGLISSCHHGLYEASLAEFYPHLDLDETVAFAASSWKSRQVSPTELADFLGSQVEAYDLFSEVFKIGFPWLNKSRDISPELKQKYEKLNPFDGKDLRARLESVQPEKVEKLKERLRDRVNNYVFECQYQDAKMARGGDNYKLVPMHFQAVYPRKGKIVPAFASEVARMISQYPSLV